LLIEYIDAGEEFVARMPVNQVFINLLVFCTAARISGWQKVLVGAASFL
jgi:hypothetical protein